VNAKTKRLIEVAEERRTGKLSLPRLRLQDGRWKACPPELSTPKAMHNQVLAVAWAKARNESEGR
jgi:hypothetical protein